MRSEFDFYQLEKEYNAEELAVRDSVREFVQKRIKPRIAEAYQKGEFFQDLIPEIAELGLLGSTLKEYGGAGVSHTAYGLINQELEAGDSGLRSFVSVQSGLVIHPIYSFGSEEQKAKWLPKLIDGSAIGCFGLTEPDFGSNPSGMRTKAVKDGDSYVLNGAKMWITNGSIADVAVVFAKYEEGIAAFLVDKGTPGFSAPVMKGKLSLRASITSELVFDNCRIPAENRLPKAEGLKAALSCLNQARYGIAWGVVGAARACFEEALDYAKSRVQFDRPIAGYQMVQGKLVEMYSDIVLATLLCQRLSKMKEAGTMPHVAISIAKRNNVAMARKSAKTAREILGANGITDEYSALRHMCNIETVFTYEGTHDIHTLIVGQALTGLPAFFG